MYNCCFVNELTDDNIEIIFYSKVKHLHFEKETSKVNMRCEI